MRICYIVEAMATGVGRHVVDLAQGMSGRGHEVHVIYSPLRADPTMVAKVAALPGVRMHEVAMPHKPGPRDLVAMMAIWRCLVRHGPFDVIHGHSAKGGLYARMVALFDTPVTVYSPHAFITMSPRLSSFGAVGYGMVERGLSLASSRIVCTSGGEVSHARDLGIAARRLLLVHNGICEEGFDPPHDLRGELGVGTDAMVVGFVGRLEEQKAPDVLVEAAAIVCRATDAVHFAVIGKGAMETGLRAQARALGLDGRVHWLGGRFARPCIPCFDVLAMPSRYEGFPYTMLEAQRCGVPVIGTRFGGAEEILRDGFNGLVVPMEDPAALAERILDLARDPALRRRMGENARGLSSYFSIDRMCRDMEAVYLGRAERPAQLLAKRVWEKSAAS